jgi:KipI family sensor histidine kinase inhibitor
LSNNKCGQFNKKLLLNCDLAEVDVIDKHSAEIRVMPIIDQANIACGAHAGNKNVISETLALAYQHNIQIGAHPSYPDRENFGRKSINIGAPELTASILSQINCVMDSAEALPKMHKKVVTYVKPHGALYNDLIQFPTVAECVFKAVSQCNKEHNLSLELMISASAPPFIEKLSKQFQISLIREAFIDRRYLDSGHLMPRRNDNCNDDDTLNTLAVLPDSDAYFQAMTIVNYDFVITESGTPYFISADTLCIHGDNPSAYFIADLIRQTFNSSMTIEQSGCNAIKVYNDSIRGSLDVAMLAQAFKDELKSFISVASPTLTESDLVAITPAFNSLFIELKPTAALKLISAVELVLEAYKRTTQSSSEIDSINPQAKSIKLPVYYDQTDEFDLKELASENGLSVSEAIELHQSTKYRVEAIGFAPGFAYLSGLTKRLDSRRRSEPRTSVPKGTVAIANDLTCVYPQSSPGGWNIIGRCPMDLFDPSSPTSPMLYKLGDTIQFQPVSKEDYLQLSETQTRLVFEHQQNKAKGSPHTDHDAGLKVKKLPPSVLYQDLGRNLVSHFGLTSGGAADVMSFYWANRLLGNEPNSTVLEIMFGNCQFIAQATNYIVVTGAKAPIFVNDNEAETWQLIKLNKGDVVNIGYASSGLRLYLAIEGGFKAQSFWESTSAVLRENIGQTISNNETLYFNNDKRHVANKSRDVPIRQLAGNLQPIYPDQITVRVTLDEQVHELYQSQSINGADKQAFLSASFTVSPASDRMGVRLHAGSQPLRHKLSLESEGIGLGAIQVPPDGNPIILLADRQTIGGYPKLGHVIAPDCYRLSQAQPGTKVRFELVTHQQAASITADFFRYHLYDC